MSDSSKKEKKRKERIATNTFRMSDRSLESLCAELHTGSERMNICVILHTGSECMDICLSYITQVVNISATFHTGSEYVNMDVIFHRGSEYVRDISYRQWIQKSHFMQAVKI